MIMEKLSLGWAIVWGFVFIMSIVAVFWNPAHFFTMAISGMFFYMFIRDYRKERKANKRLSK